VADLARRVQDRVDGQDALLDRVADLVQRPDDRARVAEVRGISRRLRRDSEALLLLCGADPGVHRGASHTVPAVLGDAVALVDEPTRVAVASAPSATLAASAAVELRHLVAELVDEADAASPGARIEVGAYLERDGALVVEIVAGRVWTDTSVSTPRGGFAGTSRIAERLARRSTGGISLQRPRNGDVEGLVAALHCPASLVTGRPGGDPWPLAPAPSLPSRTRSAPSYSAPSYAAPSYAAPSYAAPSSSAQPEPSSLLLASAPARSGGDELFGPLPSAPNAVGTPIFEAVASAWFRDDERVPTSDWNSPGDREWRAAAARASRTDAPPPTTASGLPRRSPGDRLVAPSRAALPASDERAPERVRDRLATYQRGLRQGRHRAADPTATDPGSREPAPEAWTAEGW
jgi:hypothetical protein